MIFDLFTKKPKRKVVFFTTHKAGSMVLHNVLRDICLENRISYYSPNSTGSKKFPYNRVFTGEDFIADRQGCFGALRFFVPSTALTNASIVIHLRDPRDVLTSMFYSYCFMHPAKYPGEIEPNTGYRKVVADAGIDKFVLDMSDDNFSRYQGDYGTGCNFGQHIGHMKNRYDKYLNEVLGKPNVTVVSYEEMVLDFAGWLRKVVDAFALEHPEDTVEIVMERYSKSVKPEAGEDVRSHKRKVTPGDHKEKLKVETINELNERFREAMDVLGYLSPDYAVKNIPVYKAQIRR